MIEPRTYVCKTNSDLSRFFVQLFCSGIVVTLPGREQERKIGKSARGEKNSVNLVMTSRP
jgi:hypothetical protein